MIRELTSAVDGTALPSNQFASVLYEGEKVRVVVRDDKVIEVLAR